jgi:hypothetical protein
MTDSLFKVAGVSQCKGSHKVRFANDMTRIKVLVKTGHSDIELIDLPKAMSKSEIATHLKTTALYQRPEYAAAIDAADDKYNGARTVKVAGIKVKAPAKIVAKQTEAEVA